MKAKLKSVPINELERTYEKCLAYTYAFPQRTIGLNELSTLIKSSKSATKQAVEALMVQQFFVRETVGKAWLLSVNEAHPFLKIKKIPYHLDKIYESGVVDVIHKEVPHARAIILFGSYRKGDDTEKSDIDIAAEVIDNKELEIVLLGVIRQIGYRKNVPVNVHLFSRNKIDLNLFANIANGIVLDGFLEVRP